MFSNCRIQGTCNINPLRIILIVHGQKLIILIIDNLAIDYRSLARNLFPDVYYAVRPLVCEGGGWATAIAADANIATHLNPGFAVGIHG